MFKATYSFVDNKSAHTSREVYLANQADHAANVALAAAIGAEFEALSQAHVDKIEVSYIVSQDLVRPAGNVNMGVVAAFGVRNDDLLISRITVPAPIAGAVQAESDLLDRTNAQVAAVITRLESGAVMDKRGALFVNVEYAEEEGGNPGE